MIEKTRKIYQITPVAKPRMTARDKWRPAAKKYFKFAEDCKALGMKLPEGGASVTFYIPVFKSWSKKKQRDHVNTPHQHPKGPDLSNLVKAVEDALYGNDAYIWDLHARKLWSYDGAIAITTNEITDDDKN